MTASARELKPWLSLQPHSPHTPQQPLPFQLWRKRQNDVSGGGLSQFDLGWAIPPPVGREANDAPKALADGAEIVVPAAPLEMPPEAMRIKTCAVAASANRAHGLAPHGGLGQSGSDGQAIGRPARHITAPAWLAPRWGARGPRSG